MAIALAALVGSWWLVGGTDTEDAYADMSNTLGSVRVLPVRGRIVAEADPVDITRSLPRRQISQEELDYARVSVALVSASGARTEVGQVRADEEGYLDAHLDLSPFGLSPGRYKVEVALDGRVIGSSTARLLAVDHTAPVVRSDIDLTYLLTDSHSERAVLDLLEADATERTVLPAMDLVYRALRDGATGTEDRPLVFLSGCPSFFKRTLEGKAELDGVEQDGLVLKPFADVVVMSIGDLLLHSTLPKLRGQIGYKLYWLLRLRTEVPPTASELLLGDDSEADFVIYNLYYRFLVGDLGVDALLTELDHLGVAPGWRHRIATVAPDVVAAGVTGRVRAIYINRTARPSRRHSVSDWALADLTRHHQGAWPLILDFFEEGWVAGDDVSAVQTRLLELGQTPTDLDAAASDGIAGGFLRQETVLRFHQSPSAAPALDLERWP